MFERYKHRALKTEETKPPLTDVPNVRLGRPLVICPGWNTERYKFRHLVHKLEASGENGHAVYLQRGQAYADCECTKKLELSQIPSNTKIFVCEWDSIKAAPDVTAPQLAENLEAVQHLTGAERVDLVGYSMGGLAGRKYLDNGGDAVGRFLMLGTPNQGTRFGEMVARVVDHDVDWAQKLTGVSGEDREVMRWLAHNGDELKELNGRWPQQRARVDQAMAVGSRQEWTPTRKWTQLSRGDSMVEPDALQLDGMPTAVLHGSEYLHHGSLPHDSQVYGEMMKFFGWEPAGGNYQPLPPTPRQQQLPYARI